MAIMRLTAQLIEMSIRRTAGGGGGAGGTPC
jgi:hypothetical protein